MESLHACMNEYRKQLEKGYIQNAYKGLMEYIMGLRTHLKIAVVFNYDQFRFEVWLAGYNKQIQQKYWELFKESDWNKYRIPSATKGVDSILEYTLADNPDFDDLNGLTKQIEKGTLNFISDIEDFLSKH
ncbi:DUF7000 family protein [Chloroflexota bacterium]